MVHIMIQNVDENYRQMLRHRASDTWQDVTYIFPMPNGKIVVQNIVRNYRDTFTDWRAFLEFFPHDPEGTHPVYGFRKVAISGKYNA